MVQDDSTMVLTQQITLDSKNIGSFKLGLSTASIASALTQLYMLLAVSTLGGTAAMVIILTRLFAHKISKLLRKITGFAQPAQGQVVAPRPIGMPVDRLMGDIPRLGRLTVLEQRLMLASRSPKCAHSCGLGQTIVRQA